MFEDSLVESSGRIHTRSRWFAVGSFALQTAVLAVLILIPILYPAALPKQVLSTLLVAPPPPAAAVQMPQARAAHPAAPVQLSGLIAPRIIPRHIAQGDSSTAAPPRMDGGFEHAGPGEVQGAIPLLGSTPPAPPVVARLKPSAPIRVSAGVAAGHILVPIQAVYPAIAKNAHIQGTVKIDAVISKDGFVTQAHVVSGPPLLVQAALEAVNRARYVPFKLNGEPVEVDTAINIVFTLGE
jgi:protein TonB